jgi:branched-chain amino acid transport system ATP-binding protein
LRPKVTTRLDIDNRRRTAYELQHKQGKTIVIVEQNAKKELEFADIGYVLVSGELALAVPAKELLADSDVGRLFLGG